MTEQREMDELKLALGLIDVMPKLVRRIHAELPVVQASEQDEQAQNVREVLELRATLGQLSLLRILYEHETCTMLELARHLTVAPSTATSMVKRLLTQGYVERARDEENWRSVLVTLTEHGRQVFELYQHLRLEALAQRLQRLNTEERQAIIAALPALQRLIEESQDQ